ncbi:PepSY domain-containing protein [Rhodococcus aetherivorans]|uniref:Uncharacterized iron-regulated membrane protein n=1 Tax=Rhodococcus aetherivorans TaxID=191292 RepID=A0ABQ0YLD9_9NOCA|nr:PepSY-associated TM helix domain-containing protein [Rhodococcus aetherivorans]ETT23992.1 putative iron-regulated membrane protein-like protein [Rhodococcus rhodochrous ATCC 21198]NGP27917.1 PepSY domain-containing protein [Rhodococcus aetherivorans]UGQ42561.1 PepSY domain-containing protein [Rhodococcus aetherivorans]GES37343.1 uncharacterized iron-regulated membrane protein [Rhodococcus aetherivorans]
MSTTDLGTDRPVPPRSGPDRSAAPALRPLMLRLHFYAGILVAPFILIAAVSGGLYALAPTIEQLVYRDQLHTDATGPAVPVAEQIRVAAGQRPDLTVTAVRPAAAPGETTRVLFADPSLGESQRLAVFVDPVTARPLGELAVYGSSSALPVRTWISQLHRHLHLGEPGRLYSELAASWMWVIALGGVYLWVRRYRTVRARHAQARLLTVDRTATGRSRTLGWHGVVGVWIAVGLVFLSATGLTWSRFAGDNIAELRAALHWKTPTVDATLTGGGAAAATGHEGHGGHAGHAADPGLLDANIARIDPVLDTAAAAGLTGVVEASIPARPGTAFTVAETRQPWVYGIDSVAVDGATGEVVDVSRFADWPLAAQLTWWSITLHMGIMFGLVTQVALALLAVALITVVLRGYVMWWRRRPTRGSAWAVGRAPARGALRRIGAGPAVAIGVAAAVVGWFAPVLGLSLLAFLVVDTAVGWRMRGRA